MPYVANGERVGRAGQWIAVDEQQVGERARDDAAAVREPEPARGSGGGRAQGVFGPQSCRGQQLQFVMQAGAVRESPRMGMGSDMSEPASMSTPASRRALMLAYALSRLPCG